VKGLTVGARRRRAFESCQVERQYYILDGRAGFLRARQQGLDSIEAMVLLLTRKVNFGIVKLSKP
jgi:hypothetical protein